MWTLSTNAITDAAVEVVARAMFAYMGTVVGFSHEWDDEPDAGRIRGIARAVLEAAAPVLLVDHDQRVAVFIAALEAIQDLASDPAPPRRSRVDAITIPGIHRLAAQALAVARGSQPADGGVPS